MSWVICCDYDDCGRVDEGVVGLGGAPHLPSDWTADDARLQHFCSTKCKREHERKSVRSSIATKMVIAPIVRKRVVQ